MAKQKRPFLPLNVAVLTVSDRRTREDDTSGDAIQVALEAAGHNVVVRDLLRNDLSGLRERFADWIADAGIDAVITSGGTGLTRHDITPEALAPLVTKPIPGFGELFRWLSYEDIGTSTIQSRAEAAIAGDTLVFLLPGSTGACRLGMDKIILPQLDASQSPCNLIELLPRFRHE